MTTKPKTRKAPVAAIDPVFAAIAEHKVLTRELNRLEGSCKTARAKAEKRYGKWERTPNPGEWPGERPSHRFTFDGTAPAMPRERRRCVWPGQSRRRFPVPPP